MAQEYKGQNPLDIAKQAEKDMNSLENRTGTGKSSDSGLESGVNEAGAEKFPGGSVTYGSAASGRGDNREIPESEGGSIDAKGRATKAKDFEGEGGPEDKQRRYEEDNGGNEDILSNVRQGGETRRP
ncbi:hypothetical protein BLS_005628 [Venturia inaequalis]|uniref:Uncharacterized protein n=1 Tax=Venturia inaequalis TaxID=5025 RepID=A0A8H3Z6L8_VENIN|nr:hypothetical protein BLS_005628 [Venturia inaequalis]KAE9982467.1 hypothetical protein EG328_010857 [Venturia inaequalis]RDI76387.1 hypothetical protein Vi05172_g13603 [Venturia inaequalis]